MELRINLADPADIAAAIPLLQSLTAPPAHVELAPPSFDAATTQAFPGTPDTRTVAEVDALIKAENAPNPDAVFAPPLVLTTAAATPATVAPLVPAPPAHATQTSGPASSPAPAPSAGAELDSAGVPWSADLHAANKSKCQDGTWKARRGLKDAPPAPVAQPNALATQPWPFPTTPATDAPTTFAQLMPRVTAAITAGILPPAEMRVACDSCGVPSVVALQETPAAVPLIWAWLRERYPAIA